MRKVKVRTKKSLNCLWSTSSRCYAHSQEVRAEIKYMCTSNLSPNEIICSSYNHHSKQLYNTQSHLRFETIFLFPKSIYIYGLSHWSVHRAGWLITTRKWWATTCNNTLFLVLLSPLSQCCRFPHTGMERRQFLACLRNDFSDTVFKEWQINGTFEEEQYALPEDLGSISGQWVPPGEHSKGGLIMGEIRTTLRKVLGICWQKE